jgi:hypothetical protein
VTVGAGEVESEMARRRHGEIGFAVSGKLKLRLTRGSGECVRTYVGSVRECIVKASYDAVLSMLYYFTMALKKYRVGGKAYVV